MTIEFLPHKLEKLKRTVGSKVMRCISQVLRRGEACGLCFINGTSLF